MTASKPRKTQPHTNNAVGMGLGMFKEPLKTVIETYFDPDTEATASIRIHDAIMEHGLAVKTNPMRKAASLQRRDLWELTECMKELNVRLHPMHIPLPLLRGACSAYVAPVDGEPTLSLEIRNLLLRLHYLQELFEATGIPQPTWTNPGKPERDNLVSELKAIFDELTAQDYLPSSAYPNTSLMQLNAQKQNDKKQFVRDVLAVFKLPIPRL